MTLPKPTWAGTVATVFGAGLSPVAPGTVGSVCAIPAVLLLGQTRLAVQIVAALGVLLVGTVAAHLVAASEGTEDPQIVVVDEVAGMLVTFLGISINFWSVILGLALFRFFDIWKPFPVGWLDQNVKGGPGIMLDDLAAGIMACVALHLGAWIL